MHAPTQPPWAAHDPVSTLSPSAAEAADVLTLPLPQLDQWPHHSLLQAVAQQVAQQGGYSPELALRLDQLLAVKVTRLMASPHATAQDRQALVALIAGLNREPYRASLDAPPLRCATRWHTLVDLLETASRIQRQQAQAVARAQAGASLVHRPQAALWAAIARRVAQAGPQGLAMADAAEEISRHHGAARSKGAVSQTVSAMCLAGWLASVADGRQKRLYIGTALPADVLPVPPQAAATAATAASTPGAPSARGVGLQWAKETVCLNQGLLLSYYDEAHQRHLRLRDALAEATAQGSDAALHEPATLARLRQLKLELDDYLDKRLTSEQGSVLTDNFKLLPRQFEGRSDLLPRICFKGSWQAGDDSDMILPVIRDNGRAPYDWPLRTSLRGRNTGFEAVQASGRAFLAQDLAALAMAGEYHNPRLNPEAVAQLAAEFGPLRLQDISWQRWQACWQPTAGAEARGRDCYRSTLIVPLTLRNNLLDDALRERLRHDVPEFKKDETWERAILGYLCFDHPMPGYFRAEDEHLGYIVADQLSLYVLCALSVTTLSKTYQAVSKLLAAHAHTSSQQLPITEQNWPSRASAALMDGDTDRNVVLRFNVAAPAHERQPTGTATEA